MSEKESDSSARQYGIEKMQQEQSEVVCFKKKRDFFDLVLFLRRIRLTVAASDKLAGMRKDGQQSFSNRSYTIECPNRRTS